jgi:hypothetical protein
MRGGWRVLVLDQYSTASKYTNAGDAKAEWL